MKRSFWFVAVAIIPAIFLCASVYGSDPIKWSAPMNEYPNSWYPTAAPRSYYIPTGTNNPLLGLWVHPAGITAETTRALTNSHSKGAIRGTRRITITGSD